MTDGVDRERSVICPDPEATTRLGEALGAVAAAGDLICLWGELGAGKTHLAKAIGRGLGVDRRPSPRRRFILMAEYDGRLPLFHVDLYRLADGTDALAGGLIDDRQSAGVTLVEWPERLGDALPARAAGRPDRRVRRRAADDPAHRPSATRATSATSRSSA